MGTQGDDASKARRASTGKKGGRASSAKKTAKKAASKTTKKAAKKTTKKTAVKAAKKTAKKTAKKPGVSNVGKSSKKASKKTGCERTTEEPTSSKTEAASLPVPAVAPPTDAVAEVSHAGAATAIAEMVGAPGPKQFSEVDPDPDVDALVESDAVQDAASLMEVEVVDTMGVTRQAPRPVPTPVTWVCASPAPRSRRDRAGATRRLAIFALGLLSGWVAALIL